MSASPVPIPAVSVAVVRGDRILLVRRGCEPSRGLWAFPGGRQEAGESAEAAARRELFEETALIAGSLAVLRTIAVASASGHMFELTVFIAERATGALAAGDDAQETGWFSLDEIEQMELVESVRTIARELLVARLAG